MKSKPMRVRCARHARATAQRIQHVANLVRAARRRVRGLDAALRRPSTYRHPAGRIFRIETHIPVVYLAGRFAYKIIRLSFKVQCCLAVCQASSSFPSLLPQD